QREDAADRSKRDTYGHAKHVHEVAVGKVKQTADEQEGNQTDDDEAISGANVMPPLAAHFQVVPRRWHLHLVAQFRLRLRDEAPQVSTPDVARHRDAPLAPF